MLNEDKVRKYHIPNFIRYFFTTLQFIDSNQDESAR